VHTPLEQPLPNPGATLAPLTGHAAHVRHAGAVMVVRWGSAVAGHYGSVAGELAVCLKRVGIADRSDLEKLELHGREAWLEHALAKALGDRVPAVGQAIGVAGTWCCRTAPERALVIGAHPSVARWRRFAREAVVAGSAIGCRDLAADASAISLVGPRAVDVLRGAGLRDGIAVGGVAAGTLAGSPLTLLREDVHRFLLVLHAGPCDAAWEALFAAGRPLGLAYVGCEALERLAAVPRPLALAG
jgi:glycine cleavage system aminomethyltransferase T